MLLVPQLSSGTSNIAISALARNPPHAPFGVPDSTSFVQSSFIKYFCRNSVMHTSEAI
jgi:hypothetical protein